MIITEIKEADRSELLVFFTLSELSAGEVTDWIARKIKDGEISLTGNHEQEINSIQECCMKKFGERPHVIDTDKIRPIKIG